MGHTDLSTPDLSARTNAEMLVRGGWRLVPPFAEAWWKPERTAHCTEQRVPLLAEALHRTLFARDPQQGRA